MRHRLIRPLVPLLAAFVLGAGAPAASGSIPLGQVAAAPTGDCGANFDFIQGSVAAGNSYTVPAAGTITSWSSSAGIGAGPGAQFTIKVFRPVAALRYSVVGHDGPRPLAGSGVSTFASNLPVKPGDLLGIHTSTIGTNCTGPETGLSADTLLFRGTSDLADGSSEVFTQENDHGRFNIAAQLAPANTFTLGAFRRNQKKGTATLAVSVPNPGTLTLSGKGVKAAGGAAVSKAVATAGEVKLSIRAKGKKQRTLNETGTVNLNLEVTYTPSGGDAREQSTKLKLRKR
jgi:hypothetical protein